MAAAGPQFASCNAILAATTTTRPHVLDHELHLPPPPSPLKSPVSDLARRSISIFSRRGHESPSPRSPKPSPPPTDAMDRAEQLHPTPARRRRRSSVSANVSFAVTTTAITPQKSRSDLVTARLPHAAGGTILKAVPRKAAQITGLIALEEESAASPNEEILATIDSPSAAQISTVQSSLPHHAPSSSWSSLARSKSFIEPPIPLESSPSIRTKLARRKSTNDRIGMWVNGVAHWDPEPNSKAKRVLGISPSSLNLSNTSRHNRHWSLDDVAEPGFIAFHEDSRTGSLCGRPSLSVYIPTANDPEELPANSIPRPSIIAEAPASVRLTKFAGTPPSTQHPAHRSFHPSITIHELGEETSPTDSVAAPPQLTDKSKKVPPSPTRLDALPSALAAQDTSASNFTDSVDTTNDERSMYSKPSSATSAEQLQPTVYSEPERKKRDSAHGSRPSSNRASRDKPLPPVPDELSGSQSLNDCETYSTIPVMLVQHQSSARWPPTSPKTKTAFAHAHRVVATLDQYDADFIRSSPRILMEPFSEREEEQPYSPGFSHVEHQLNDALAELSASEAFSDVGQSDNEGPRTAMLQTISLVRRNTSVRSVMQPPKRVPTLPPPRSRKRDWQIPDDVGDGVEASDAATEHKKPVRRSSESNMRKRSFEAATRAELQSASLLRRRSIQDYRAGIEIHDFANHRLVEPVKEQEQEDGTPAQARPTGLIVDDGLVVVDGPVTIVDPGLEVYLETIEAAAQAEVVLLQILTFLQDPQDLANTAIINKGMYRVYKENEMALIRSIHFNHSPAGWEFREWCPPTREEPDGPDARPRSGTSSREASICVEHTPLTYTRCQKRDAAVIEGLKDLILKHCASFIRKDTAAALADPTDPRAQRFTDAFWRIWCFCKIFGCNKDREDDITGQLDWLKGGSLADVQDCGATVSGNLDLDMSSVLLNAPEHFAKGNNRGGLSEEELYDMTEMWTCLTTLLSGFFGRTKQAREAGIFDDFELREGDVENEESFLEEWIYYLLTLGLDVILDMAAYAKDESTAGFDHAFENGWTTWSSPEHGGSRITFLKEPVSRLYEERVATSELANPAEVELKARSRQRVASLAAEIRLARQTSGYKRLPLIDQANERPMSMFSRSSSTRSGMTTPGDSGDLSASNSGRVPSHPSLRPAAHTRSASATSTYSTMTPGTTTPSHAGRPMRSIAEGRVENFNRQSLQNFGTGEAANTSERAIRRITDMGFTVKQAKNALRATDMGDGLRVDRAVDLLLRQRDA